MNTTTPTDRPAARYPGAAVRYVGALGVLAGAVLVFGGLLVGDRWMAAADAAVLLLAVLGAASVVYPLRFHHDGDVQGFNLTSAAFLAVAMRVPDVLALQVAAGMAIVGFVIATRSVVKTAFNAAQVVLAATAALLAAQLVAGGELTGDVLRPQVLASLAVGSVVYAAVTGLLVIELLRRLSGNDLVTMLREVFAPATWGTASDFVAAVLLTVLADRSPGALVLAVPMFMALVLGYRGFAADREAGRQAQLLHGTSRQLLDGALDDAALQEAVAGLRDLFGAERAVLAAPDASEPSWLTPVLEEIRGRSLPVIHHGDAAVMAAPVRLEGQVVGVLGVSGRRGVDTWGPADLDLLSTVSGEIAATLRTRRLLAEVEHERAQLAAETSKLTDVLASASNGIVVLDATGRVQACNEAMREIVGSERQTIGAPWREVLHFEDGDGRPLVALRDHPLYEALMGDTRIEGTTVSLRRPDGTLRWLRCSVAPVLSDGTPDGVVLVAVDLTREREVEQMRSDFIATVSHELRTPLTPLRGFIGVLREHGGALDAERRGMMVDAMQKQVHRLSDLIADLLEVAEMEQARAVVRSEDVALADSVRETLDLEAGSLEDRARIEVEVGDLHVRADPSALRRILRALVSNGLKHTDGLVHLSAAADDEYVHLRVRDEGPGIQSADREVIFEPFRRLGNHLHRTQGPGLGLTVARSLAEALDGSLELEDAEDGAVFVLRVPRTDARDRLRAIDGTG